MLNFSRSFRFIARTKPVGRYIGDVVDTSRTVWMGQGQRGTGQDERVDVGGVREKLVSPTGSALITEEHEDEL